MTDEDKLQVLGGVLIILSLALLYCWSMKEPEGMSNQLGPSMYGSFKNSDGFDVPRTVTRKQLYDNVPGVNFSAPITSLNGMTNHSTRPLVLPNALQNKVSHTDARWLTDGFISSPVVDRNAVSHLAQASMNDTVGVHGESAMINRGSYGGPSMTIGDAVTTPVPQKMIADNMRDLSTTSVQMKMVQDDPIYPQYLM